MPLPANVTLQVSVNGGPVQTGAVVAEHGDVVQLSIADFTGVLSARWQLDDYPAEWPVPPGWEEVTEGRDAGKYRVDTLNDDEPPAFTLPADTALWGKFMPSVLVNNGIRNGAPAPGLFDNRTAVRINSPSGCHGVAFGETTQFDQQRQKEGEIQQSLRKLEDAVGSTIAPGGPLIVTPTLLDARTRNTRVSGGVDTQRLDTRLPNDVTAPNLTNTTVYSEVIPEDSSVLISVIVMVLNSGDDEDNTTQEFKARYDNIGGTVTERVMQAAGDFDGDTSYLTGSIAGTTVSIVYNGPEGDLYTTVQVVATPPGAWA